MVFALHGYQIVTTIWQMLANFFDGPLLVESTNTKPNLVSSLKNDMFDTPSGKEYGEDIAIFES